MKAWVLHGVGDLRLEEVLEPVLGDQEVLVAVKAAGICGSDIPRIYRTGAHVHPLICGHEFSGEVVQVGQGADKRWLGQRVGIFPLIPCGICGPCREKRYEMCRGYSYLGSRRDGGFGEHAAVPEWNLIPLPRQATFEEAAMLEPMAVAVHAMRRAIARVDGEFLGDGKEKEHTPQKKAAVCGLGTIGLLLLMFLKEAGWETVYAIGNKDSQREMARNLGVGEEFFCDSRKQEPGRWLRESTSGAGADVFFECVGKEETYGLAVDHTSPGGTVVLVGNPCSDMTLKKETYWKILRNQLTMTGTWNSSYLHEPGDDWNYVLEKLEQGRIAPSTLISHRFSLKDLGRGFELMRDKTEDYVKVMGKEP